MPVELRCRVESVRTRVNRRHRGKRCSGLLSDGARGCTNREHHEQSCSFHVYLCCWYESKPSNLAFDESIPILSISDNTSWTSPSRVRGFITTIRRTRRPSRTVELM
jgi:hypothetical protein